MTALRPGQAVAPAFFFLVRKFFGSEVTDAVSDRAVPVVG